MILSFINIRKVPREGCFALGFQHFPLDLVDVFEWKIMFDPSNNNTIQYKVVYSGTNNKVFLALQDNTTQWRVEKSTTIYICMKDA